jgi:phosphate transport system permease protein
VRFHDRWLDGRRSVEPVWNPVGDPWQLSDSETWVGVTGNGDHEGNLLVCAWTEGGRTSLIRWQAGEELWQPVAAGLPSGLRSAAVAEGLATIAGIDPSGGLRIFDLSSEPVELEVSGLPANAERIRYLLGGRSLVVADREGGIHALVQLPRVMVYNRGARQIRAASITIAPGESAIVPDDDVGFDFAADQRVEVKPAPPQWRVVRTLGSTSSRATSIAPSHRRRGFLVGTDDGMVALYHATSGRLLLTTQAGGEPVSAVAFAPRADGVVAATAGAVYLWKLENPHPEVSLRTLFLPVWYEGYAAPRWVWQTSGGGDDFEPKFSLWPLLVGTFKATLYAMLLSVPLAIMAALYVSQLAPRWLQTVVKPTVELMAAVPSVVVGFLAALWLAPRLEAALFSVLLAALALPLTVVAVVASVKLLPPAIRRRVPPGGELLFLLVGGLLILGGVALIARPLEDLLFNQGFARFLFEELGIRYDQRNAVVVGVALGFAIVPVIFTIAEDACSSVPKSLVRAARALGATRWQAAIRLVLPAASPGLFAAVMLGLGRAVGETMIVLMAAGNTPILDFGPFNGMRTMSAAIAIEIPEAAVGGTLYRVLFLTGCLLFASSLLFTTAADIVGRELRRRYARF